MQAIVYHRYGSQDVLEVAEVERPAPGPGQVLIRVHAASGSNGAGGSGCEDSRRRISHQG